MALRSTLFLLLLVLALVAKSSAGVPQTRITGFERPRTGCMGLVGDCIDEDEEMGMESESTRRGLRGRGSHISYDALSRDRVPCNQRGASYYNCNQRSQVNPYRRGCSAITRCARSLNWLNERCSNKRSQGLHIYILLLFFIYVRSLPRSWSISLNVMVMVMRLLFY